MTVFALLAVTTVLLIPAVLLMRKWQQVQRQQFLDNYKFPSSLRQKVHRRYPHLTDEQLDQVMDGLRTFFQLSQMAGRRFIAMPSQVVDVAWHEFILFTRLYQQFCRQALGRFLHHTPAEAMSTPTLAQDGIKRTWRLSCRREGIDPQNPSRLPLLFAIDSELGIADGFRYQLNCQPDNGNHAYCASHIGCGSCGGDSHSSDGDSSCGGGCGGD